jgi:hypothetical protein
MRKRRRESRDFLTSESEKIVISQKKSKIERFKTILSAVLMTIFGLFLLIPISGINIYELLRPKKEVVASVNGNNITIGEVRYYIRLSNKRKPPNMKEKDFYKQTIEEMIQSKLLEEEAKNYGYDVSKIRIYLIFRRYFANKYGEFNYNIYKRWLQRVGVSESSAYDFMKEFLVVKDYYEDISNLLYVPMDYKNILEKNLQKRFSFFAIYINDEDIKSAISYSPTRDEILALKSQKEYKDKKDEEIIKILKENYIKKEKEKIKKILGEKIKTIEDTYQDNLRENLKDINYKYHISFSVPANFYEEINFEEKDVPSITKSSNIYDGIWEKVFSLRKDKKGRIGIYDYDDGILCLFLYGLVDIPIDEGKVAEKFDDIEYEGKRDMFEGYIRKIFERAEVRIFLEAR